MKPKNTKVAMIGCGKLGQDCAEVMAQQYMVEGYDVEPRQPENFAMKGSIAEAVKDKDIVFIAAPTPHDPRYDGSTPTAHLEPKDFDYTIVKNILREVNQVVNKKQCELEPLITNARFVYNPYLIAMGSVKWDMVNPEMIMIGTEDGSKTGDAKELIDFYKPMMQNSPRYVVGTWDECESIKIFYNTFISAKIGLVNMIQDVAEKQGNINVDVVTSALAYSDMRIMGPKYMTAGMGDGGACHPRDNIALRWMADHLGLGYDLFDAIMGAREVQAENLAKKLMSYNLPIVIVGKAYKPHVPYTNGSYSLLIGHYIEKAGRTLYYKDEHTGDIPPKTLGRAVYLLAHNPKVTYGTDDKSKYDFPQGSIIVDPWRQCPQLEGCTVIEYGNTRNV
jgi:UDPglucose 6-dehydrogenase